MEDAGQHQLGQEGLPPSQNPGEDDQFFGEEGEYAYGDGEYEEGEEGVAFGNDVDLVGMLSTTINQLQQPLGELREETFHEAVKSLEGLLGDLEKRESDFRMAAQIGQMLLERNQLLMKEAQEQEQGWQEMIEEGKDSNERLKLSLQETEFANQELSERNEELVKKIAEWEVKCKLLQSKHQSENDSRDQFLEYIKEIEEENQQLKNKIKADAAQMEKTRKVIQEVENYKAELEEIRIAHERLKKTNANLQEEAKRKKKALMKEHKDVLDQVVQQRKELEALRDVHQTNEKLRARIAELQKEKRDLEKLGKENNSLKLLMEELDLKYKALEERHVLDLQIITENKNIINGLESKVSELESVKRELEKVPLFEELEHRVKKAIMSSHGKTRVDVRKEIDSEVAVVIERILNKTFPKEEEGKSDTDQASDSEDGEDSPRNSNTTHIVTWVGETHNEVTKMRSEPAEPSAGVEKEGVASTTTTTTETVKPTLPTTPLTRTDSEERLKVSPRSGGSSPYMPKTLPGLLVPPGQRKRSPNKAVSTENVSQQPSSVSPRANPMGVSRLPARRGPSNTMAALLQSSKEKAKGVAATSHFDVRSASGDWLNSVEMEMLRDEVEKNSRIMAELQRMGSECESIKADNKELAGKLEGLNSQIKDRDEQLQALKEDLSGKDNQLALKEKAIADLEARLSQMPVGEEGNSKEKKILEAQLQERAKELEEKKAALELTIKKLKEVEEELKNLKEEASQKESALDGVVHNKEAEVLKVKEELKEKTVELTKQVENISSEVQELKKTVEEKDVQLVEMVHKLEVEHEEVKRLRVRVEEEQTQRIEEEKKAKEEVEKKTQEVEQKRKEEVEEKAVELGVQIRNMSLQMEELNVSVANKDVKLKEVEQKLQEEQGEVQRLKVLVEESSQSLLAEKRVKEEATKKVEELSEQVNTLEATVKEMKETEASKESQIFNITQKLEVEQGEVKRLRVVVEQKEQSIGEAVVQANKQKDEIVRLTNQCEEKKQELQSKEKVIESLKEESKDKGQKEELVQKLEKDVEELQKQVALVESTRGELEKNLQQAEAKVERLTKGNNEHQEQNKKLKEQLKAKEKAVKKLKEENEKLKQEVEKLKQALNEKIGKYGELEKTAQEEKNKVNLLNEEMQANKEQLSGLNATIAQLEAKLKHEEGQIANMKGVIDTRDKEKAKHEKHIKRLKQKLKKAKNEKNAKEKDGQSQIMAQLSSLTAMIVQQQQEAKESGDSLKETKQELKEMRKELNTKDDDLANERKKFEEVLEGKEQELKDMRERVEDTLRKLATTEGELKATKELYDQLIKALSKQGEREEMLLQSRMADQQKAAEDVFKLTSEELKEKGAALAAANEELKKLREELKLRETDLSTNMLHICNACKEYDEIEQRLYPTEYWSKTEKLEGTKENLIGLSQRLRKLRDIIEEKDNAIEGTQRLFLVEQKRAETAEAEVKRLQLEIENLKASLRKATQSTQELEKEKNKELEGVKKQLASTERELRRRSSNFSGLRLSTNAAKPHPQEEKESNQLLAAVEEQVQMVRQLAKEALPLVQTLKSEEERLAAFNALATLDELGQQVITCATEAGLHPEDADAQQLLVAKQREMGMAFQKVVVMTTASTMRGGGPGGGSGIVIEAEGVAELKEAVAFMESTVKEEGSASDLNKSSDEENVLVTARAMLEKIDGIFFKENGSKLRSAPDPRPLATELVGGIQGFIRLLRKVAAKSDDEKFKALIEEYANIINDRALQVKIIISVKAGQTSTSDSFEQVIKAATGLKEKIKEVIEVLCAASLKKRLAATINQVAAIKRVVDAWKKARALSTESTRKDLTN